MQKKVLSRAHEVASRGNEIASRYHEIASRGNEMLSHSHKINFFLCMSLRRLLIL